MGGGGGICIDVFIFIKLVLPCLHFLTVWFSVFLVIPAVIVTAMALLIHKCFFHQHLCWLSYDGELIWIFGGICLLLTITVIFVICRSLWSSMRADPSLGNDDIRKYQKMAKLVASMLPIVLMCLIFSLLSVNEENNVYQYFFMVVNVIIGSFTIVMCWMLCARGKVDEFPPPPVEMNTSGRPSVDNTLDTTTTDHSIISLTTVDDINYETSTDF